MFVLEDTFTLAGCKTTKDWEENDWNGERTSETLLEFLVGVIGRSTNIEMSEVVWLLL